MDAELKHYVRYVPTYHGRGQFTVRLGDSQLDVSRGKTIAVQHIENTYFHTTIVTVHVAPVGDHLFLECECGYYRRLLTPCRHILCVKRGTFIADVDCFPTTLVMGCEELYPVMSFDVVSASGPTLDGILGNEVLDIKACYGENPPYVAPTHGPIPCDTTPSTVVGVGGTSELTPMESPQAETESVSGLQKEERWRRAQLLAQMNPLVEAVANVASRMTVEGMNRTRYNATTGTVLSVLRNLIGQTTYLHSQQVTPVPESDSIMSTNTGNIEDTNTLQLLDPVHVHQHDMSAQFRRHKDMADVVQAPKKKMRKHTQ